MLLEQIFSGNKQNWLIGSILSNRQTDYFTKAKIPYMTYALILPNKFDKNKNLVLTYDSYMNMFNDPSKQNKLNELGLTQEINW